ncbi:1635_t:CDS:10, partial [Acaulospora colombiana]
MLIALQIKKRYDELKKIKYRQILVEKNVRSSKTLEAVKRHFDIEFGNLGLVSSMGIEILKGVSGKLLHGRTCAIMGPSGAGKTTFVSLLTGKHSALMRLPADMERGEKKRKVIEIIKFLGLDHVMDSAIGNEEERGISGGQRKRVNIGMELVAEPSILFLDEPTSGLDSVTSLEVCTLLKSIAHQQELTIAAIIHSPSPQAFDTFDDFLLLGKGGMSIYFGERAKALEYFINLGYEKPSFLSPSDFMLEIASGKVKPSGRSHLTVADLHEIWKGNDTRSKELREISTNEYTIDVEEDDDTELMHKQTSDKSAGFVSSIYHIYHESYEYTFDVFTEFWGFLGSSLFWKSDPIRETPNFFVAFALLFKRACLQLYRKKAGFLYDQAVHLVSGVFISFAISPQDYIGKVPQDLCKVTPYIVLPSCLSAADGIQDVGIFMALGATFCAVNAGTTTFGYERVVYWRDTAAGMRTIPYFLAKVVADIPRILLASLMYSLAFILFYAYRAAFYEIYLIVLLLYLASWAMGYFMSTVVAREKLGLAATGLALAYGLVLNGASPKLDVV